MLFVVFVMKKGFPSPLPECAPDCFTRCKEAPWAPAIKTRGRSSSMSSHTTYCTFAYQERRTRTCRLSQPSSRCCRQSACNSLLCTLRSRKSQSRGGAAATSPKKTWNRRELANPSASPLFKRTEPKRRPASAGDLARGCELFGKSCHSFPGASMSRNSGTPRSVTV